MKSAPSRFRGRVSLGALGVVSLLGAIYFAIVPVANVTVASGALLIASLSFFMYMVDEMFTPQEDQLLNAIFILKISLAVMLAGGFFTWFDSLGYVLIQPFPCLIAGVEIVLSIGLSLFSAVNAFIYLNNRSPGE